ncbi:MAG: alkaline phosphatase family protein [Thermoleophilia bacterium]
MLTEIFGKPSAGALTAIRDEALLGARRVGDVVVDALGRERVDLVWASVLSTHLAGHQLWDGSQVGEEAWQAAGLAGALRDVYAAADAALGRIVDALPDDADLIVCSPQGMGANTSRVDLLPGMLTAVLGERGAEDDTGGGIWRFRASIPTSARAAVSRALPEGVVRGLYASLAVRGIDWSRTRAFALPADHFGHVQLNVRGRERDGVVDPAEADELADRIAAGLLTFRDEDGGTAVDSVVRVARELDGPGVAALPDLVVRWSERPAAGLRAVVSPEHGTVRRVGAGSGRSGGHTSEAWALVRPGRSRLLAEGDGRVVDVAATACALLGADGTGLPGTPLLG